MDFLNMILTTIYKRCFQLLITILPLFFCQSAISDEPASPFVAGFDRFARHKQIDLNTGGRLLVTELNCTSCHSSSDKELLPKQGPNLTGAGNRLRNRWIKQFLDNPQETKPGTTMPDLLSNLPAEEKKKSIEALAAFLSTKHQPFPELKSTGVNPLPLEYWKKGSVQRGEQIYHQAGCVACHEPGPDYEGGSNNLSPFDKQLEQLDPEDIEELGLNHLLRPVNSVPLPDLKKKYTLKSLLFFLLNPESVRSAGRMPNLKLKTLEASDLAAYLLKDQKTNIAEKPVPESLVKQGQKLFVELNCINCHQIKNLKPLKNFTSLNKLNLAKINCVSNPDKTLPQFHLDNKQIESLKISLADLKNNKTKEKLSHQAQLDFRILKLNCYACHERDKQGGIGRNKKRFFETIGHVDIGDEGRFPPELTGLGLKMHQGWIKKVLEGISEIRPFMTIRMPRYPVKETAPLPELYSKADQYQKITETTVFGNQKGLATEGRKLINNGCIQCHQLKEEKLPGVVGVDLVGISKRIHPKWFQNFLLDPASLKTRTRMPTFFPDGKSSNPDILNGKVDRQIAAIWAYLKEIDKHPMPEKILAAQSRDTELVPEKHPILIRTFMKKAGTHAIAVGFPEKTHYAFNAETVQLSQIWKGRFLDAKGTWYERFTPPALPLGKNLISLPEKPSFAILNNPKQDWPIENNRIQFLGYRLDKQKTPTFLYRLANYEFQDRINPDGSNGFTRIIHLNNSTQEKNSGNLYFLVNSGKKLEQKKPFSYTNESGLTTVLPEPLSNKGILHKQDESTLWILPLESLTQLEVTYQW
jgi:mono/diheme cytochrome c family protein